MRTTLRLDPDVADKLRRRMREENSTLEEAANEALRKGLAAEREKPGPQFKVEPHSCRFRGGVDLNKLNQLVDELEADAGVEPL